MRLAIVDDDPEIRSVIIQSYARDPDVEIREFDSSESLISEDRFADYDLILLDAMLPGLSGFDLLEKKKADLCCPVLILSGLGDVIDKVKGLELGATDYITKPFHLKELPARINVHVTNKLSKQSSSDPTENEVHFDNFIFDMRRKELKAKQDHTLVEIPLTSSEALALSKLIENKEHPLDRQEISQAVFNRDWQPEDRSVDILIGKIRQKLAPYQSASHIQSIRNIGYKFLT
ncbi:MAG: response regulator transcription factor [Alphaproteobacteria bacterium]|nr:response regulator transcription factor [Alphaproteobacteria bacterium]